MAWTKLDIIKQAYAEIGKASYDFDLQPEDLQTALRQLDAMLAMWSGTQGVRIGFSGGDGVGALDVSSEVPMWAVEGMYYGLAMRLAPAFGKTPSPITVMNAKAGLDAIRVRCVTPGRRYIGGYGGSGNYGRAMPRQQIAVAVGADATFGFGVTSDDSINQ